MPTAPNSFTTTAALRSTPDFSAALRSVVLPAPSAPVRTRTGSAISGQALDDQVERGPDCREAHAVTVAREHVPLNQRRRARPGGSDITSAYRILFVSSAGTRIPRDG